MKISIFSLSGFNPGKVNLKDERLDAVDAITKAKKKTYLQVELVGSEAALEADVILVSNDAQSDLILQDLEFVETRLGRAEDEAEKTLLNKLKGILEKETFISHASLPPEDLKALTKYSLFTTRPITVAAKDEVAGPNALLIRAFKDAGYISFFTTGEKETRAWPIRKNTTAWEAAGVIHSDIQKGFIRAEIISFNDFIQAGGETAAKQAGKLRLEQKDYCMQDADLANFRFNR